LAIAPCIASRTQSFEGLPEVTDAWKSIQESSGNTRQNFKKDRQVWLINNPNFVMERLQLRITYELKPGIFDEKRGTAALLIKNSRFYFIFNP